MNYTVLGHFDPSKAGHAEPYFSERYTTIDFRGPLKISPLSYWGFGCTVITQSHRVTDGAFDNPVVDRGVTVGDYAWICSNVTLYNCVIEHHGIVSIGSVVRGLRVLPYHVAEGNPARLIRYWDLERRFWVKIKSGRTV